MKMKQSVKMAISAVCSNKMRSFLTMLGIIIGVLSVTLLISIVQGGTGSITDSMEELGGNQIIVTVTDSHKKLSYNELNTLKGTGGIKNVSPYLSGKTVAKAGGKSDDVTVCGITPAYQEVQGLDIASGRNIRELDQEEGLQVCIVGAGTAKELYGTTEVLGSSIRIDGYDYRIVGVLEEEDSSVMGSTNNSVYIPLVNAQRMLKQTAITNFYVTAEDETSLTQAQDTIDAYLLKKFGSEDSYSVLNMSNVIDMMNTVLDTLSVMLGGIAAISLLVGGIGIMNIMLVSVTERTKEIGIRKAIGAQRSDIIVQFLIESVFISLLGGIIGMLLSQGILSVLNLIFTDYYFAISLPVGMLALGFSIGVGVVFGIYPANKAAGLKPINALRFE
ncbi:efflux ABC transporter, permease protein [Marvinbryantia formatexigens DSM 14469]|uniref:Efflux ABC transporter, permease protein n=1 Tax=Marvinbryantia formatexigens DSM 14469 TaxID=478749 RepID=C6LFN0_9FIRM|nr:ABC transporter permease [Marvinbryantia formatexigens]EET60615.1 efflux ABC transporter, permease protein [Marvinbryantia formatexigens DSM 14469]UWO25602.1 ABC transporter permease [Marvinbryantia formatexigens DSM 14469]SDG17996.1 putative ABC transport system permease protein [Marvinbryantia formatexigens]